MDEAAEKNVRRKPFESHFIPSWCFKRFSDFDFQRNPLEEYSKPSQRNTCRCVYAYGIIKCINGKSGQKCDQK